MEYEIPTRSSERQEQTYKKAMTRGRKEGEKEDGERRAKERRVVNIWNVIVLCGLLLVKIKCFFGKYDQIPWFVYRV